MASIVAPFGTPVEQRPPIPTPDERLAAYKAKRFEKLKREELRRLAVGGGDLEAGRELRRMGAGFGGKGGYVKGQKLPNGELPVGKELTKINERAKKSKGKAMKLQEKAEGNLLAARAKRGEARERRGVSADPASGTTVTRSRVD